MKRIIILIFFLASFLAHPIHACDFCQKDFQKKIGQGISGSAHQEELLQLLNSSSVKSSTTFSNDPIPGAKVFTTNASTKEGVNFLSTSTEKIKPDLDKPVYLKSNNEQIRPTSFVEPGTKPDKKFSITMTQGETFIGNGVAYKGFLIDGKIPGPTLIADEGDVIEFTVENKGTVPHGLSLHAAYTQTSKYFGKIPPGEKRTHLFRAVYPGVYMYHCAPGGHAIPMHVLLGQYGMMVIRPKQKYKMEEVLGKKPDIELYLLQHELYASGKEATEGRPIYTMFNGKLFRYAESPIKARPGDFVRIHFLNVGPNNISTFHIVGIIWDYAYWQGMPNPEDTFVGGQTVLAGPSDSWIVDFRIPPDEGVYTMLTHAVGGASRGAIGLIDAKKDAVRTTPVLADGPEYKPEELSEFVKKAVRQISPHEPGTEDLKHPWILPTGQSLAKVTIQGNSFNPKVIEVPVGSTVEWTNEDVFTFFDGEFAGIHNAVGIQGPETFASPMLGHAESFKQTFTKAGEYTYMCTPHPYMKGLIRVVEKTSN